METINDQVLDQQTGKWVSLNDVSKGTYDVTCSMGPAFQNRQQETAKAFIDVASLDPGIIQQGKDIWLKNLSAPGMDLMAERARKQLLEAGMIPDEQMTDEEKEHAQAMIEAAAASQQGPTVMEQAVIEQTQANTADISSRVDERLAKIAQNARKMDLDEARFAHQLDQDSINQILDRQEAQIKTDKAIVDALNTQADTLNKLREAMGVDVAAGPGSVKNLKEQTEIVGDAQERVEA